MLQQATADSREHLRCFQSFLAALADAEGGSRLHALLAPNAIVRSEETLRTAREVDCATFARLHAQLLAQGQGALPEFTDTRLIEGAGTSDDGGSVEWFEVTEARSARTVFIAAGFEASPVGARIGWSLIGARPQRWTYRQGLLRSLCDYTWMTRTEPARARLPLDASWFRTHPSDAVRFHTLDDAHFACHMSGVCCRIDFEIAVDPAAQRVIDAIPWHAVDPAVDTRLPQRPDGRLQLKHAGQPCRFLGSRQQCLVHQVIGVQPFATCAVYPFAFAHTPEGVAVAMSTICPSVRAGRGGPVSLNRADLLDRLAQAAPRRTDAYRLAAAHPVAWEIFRDTERALLACLAARDLPMRQRLYLGTRICGAVRDGLPLQPAQWLAEPLAAPAPELAAALRVMLEKILDWDRPTLKSLPRPWPASAPEAEFADPEVLSRVLQNMLYSKSYSYEYDLTTAFNLAIVLYRVALHMQSANPGPLLESHWQDLGALGVHGMLKQLLREGVPEGFRTVVGTPDFGQWLLAL